MLRPGFTRLWPRSLQGQVLLAVALALLLVQGVSAVLLYRAQADRREAALVHAAALRIFAAVREDAGLPRPPRLELGSHRNRPHAIGENGRAFRYERTSRSPLHSGAAWPRTRLLVGPSSPVRDAASAPAGGVTSKVP